MTWASTPRQSSGINIWRSQRSASARGPSRQARSSKAMRPSRKPEDTCRPSAHSPPRSHLRAPPTPGVVRHPLHVAVNVPRSSTATRPSCPRRRRRKHVCTTRTRTAPWRRTAAVLPFAAASRTGVAKLRDHMRRVPPTRRTCISAPNASAVNTEPPTLRLVPRLHQCHPPAKASARRAAKAVRKAQKAGSGVDTPLRRDQLDQPPYPKLLNRARM